MPPADGSLSAPGRGPARSVLSRLRRSYDAAPPPLDPGSQYSQFGDPRYAAVPPDIRPRTESLKDVTARLLPYWYDAIVPDLRSGQCVLVVSHGNTVRALVRHLERMSDEQVTGLNVPTATPLAYELGPDFRPHGHDHALGTDVRGGSPE